METWKEFDANELTHSAAHHLLAIYEAGQRYGGWARVSDIARQLGITRGSVSLSLRTLRKRKLIETDQHHMVKLSPHAREIVDSVIAKREALKLFLCEVLGLSPEQAEVDSCKIEHLISPKMAERLVSFMRFLVSGDPAARDLLQRFRQFDGDCPETGHCELCHGRCLLARLFPKQGESG
ncbi:MAG: metal-dependent transcriptional regulator [Verrucomicrobiae bacterium]|nr:metal-dependent transcriptional regulator [Verrucomicrobiae bacterium]